MSSLVRICTFSAVLFGAAVAQAQPAPAPSPGDLERGKSEARALVREGVRLLEAKNYAGARDLFTSAYAKYPSAKILINLGTTHKDMGEPVAAANYYQLYLVDPEADPARAAEITAIVSSLDAKVGKLTLALTPRDAEIQVGDGPWISATRLTVVRVPIGDWTLRARKNGFLVNELRGTATAASGAVTLELAPVAETSTVTPPVEEPLAERADAPGSRPVRSMRLGAFVDVAIDGKGRGVAWSPGVSLSIRDRLEVDLRGQFSATPGAYVGVRGFLTRGAVRPSLSLGAPLFWKDGLRPGVAGGAAVSWHPSPRLYVVAEVGVSYFFDELMTSTERYDALVLVPLIGAHAQL